MVSEPNDRQTVKTYLEAAHEALAGSLYNLEGGYYGIAINRAYYAVFYAANALLITQGQARGKHSGTISAFRQFFVKSGLIEPKYSDIYGRLMDDRHISTMIWTRWLSRNVLKRMFRKRASLLNELRPF